MLFVGILSAQDLPIHRLRDALESCRQADLEWRKSTGIGNLPSFETFYLRENDPRSLGASFSGLEHLAKKTDWSATDKTSAKAFADQFSKSAHDQVNNLKILNGRSRSGNGEKEREFPRRLIESGMLREIHAAVDSMPIEAPSLSAPAPPTVSVPEVSRLRADFEKEEGRLDDPLNALNEQFREYLAKQKLAYQEAGDIKGFLATEEVMVQFKDTPGIQFSDFDEIKRLQQIHQDRWETLTRERETSRNKLLLRYQTLFENLSTDLTKAGRVDDAMVALTDARRLGTLATSGGDSAGAARAGNMPASSSPPVSPLSPATAANEFQGMTLAPDWLPERLGVDQNYTEDLRYYAERVITGAPQGAATTPDVIWGDLKWLMPVDLAIKSFGDVSAVTSSRITNQSFPHHSLTLHGFDARIEDLGYRFNRVFLISDIKGQLVSVQFVAQAPKVTVWLPHPVEDRNPVYDLVNVKRNASTGNQVSFQIIEAGTGVKMIKLVLRKPLARMELPPGVGQPPIQAVPVDLKWLEDSHWYLPAPLAARFIEIADKALRR